MYVSLFTVNQAHLLHSQCQSAEQLKVESG